ncbi:hypothetical protein Patl1_15126 [Pistacia atlantica]|uniref:Uncharacterized protein n=1 Tax=Pistacia atlantica TaxID=434234 RepID=A0ACC1B7D9_9ROSI|nr:hypothetical protein Patl1_15126 [Pistacia atlantica]
MLEQPQFPRHLGIGIGGSTVVIFVLLIWFIRRRKKQKYASVNSRLISSDPSSRSELEVGSVYFRVPLFSYKELAEATNNFSHEKELGNGGFGRVYYVNRIQNSAIEELIDPCLGYQSDEEVKRMTTSVAELAFLCLQQNNEMRPSMDEVLKQLKRIESGECKPENLNNDNVVQSMRRTVSSPDCQEASLLKNISLSPTSVTSKWVSSDIASSLTC